MEAFDAHSVLNLRDEPRMLEALRYGLSWANDARFAVSFTKCSGLQLIVDPVEELVSRGGAVKLLTSTYMSTTQPEALGALLHMKGVECRVQDGPAGFHSKFFWFRGPNAAECWAGSSNLSAGGLSTNVEWNLRSRDQVRIRETEAQFNALWTRPDVKPLTPELIDEYGKRYRASASSWLGDGVAQKSPALIAPNTAQQEALANLAALRARGARSAAIIAAPGVGKTYLAAFDVQACAAKRVLYVSHRLEHLLQARHSFGMVLPNKTLGVVGGGYSERDADFVFATIQSLSRDPELLSRRWDYLIIDEFHHVEAPSYEVLRPLKKHALLLGLTATPERQDGRDVLSWCDWNIAYEVRLAEAIERGWLLPFHYFGIADETIDFAQIPWRTISINALEEALSIERRAEMILHEALVRGFDGPRRATVGFCAGLRHARFMTDVFNARGQVAAVASGEMDLQERRELYRRFEDPHHPLEWLFVSDLLNEGVDLPAINSLLFLRPTESAGLFIQQLGRGLRLSPGTEVLTVLDFVGHHRSAWITLQALSDPKGTGRKVNAEGLVIKPPRACEVVLQSRTREILAKIGGLAKKDRCSDAYKQLHADLKRPMPVDLWHRADLPDFSEMKQVYGDWLGCEQRHNNAPAWSRGISEDHVARRFLAAAEKDWQAQRVTPYARLWGLCQSPNSPEAGYEEFFRRFPQWLPEYAPYSTGAGAGTLERKVPEDCFHNGRLAPAITNLLGEELLFEVEGRVLYAVNDDYDARHGGVLRTPDQLTLHQQYSRPEIVRHFGVQYDPARHNVGILWFDELSAAAIITKLDTSGALEQHQYRNEIVDAGTFLWTSQNKMRQDNSAGRRVLDHAKNGDVIHLFVQPRSHADAVYFGPVGVGAAEGNGPMLVTFKLRHPLGSELLAELRDEAKAT